jgi:uncharacterized protein YndB with AHSA1/START domain
MAPVSIDVDAGPEAVWAVLADAPTYGEWVVGTKEIVRADEHWPEVGSLLEYALGVGPISVGDRTVVLEAAPPRLLVLRAELQRLGAALIRLELVPRPGGTRVVMDEAPVEGIVEKLHTRLSEAALEQRNRVALDRLKRLAESRS